MSETAVAGVNGGGDSVIIVTGGTGLVGKAIEEVIQSDPVQNEKWIFLSSKDGDLWYVLTGLWSTMEGNIM